MTDRAKTAVTRAASIAAFGVMAFLLLWRQSAVTPTFDEMLDNSIVKCYQGTINPFSCPTDITQARLPYYLHAAVRSALAWFDPTAVDRTISALFILGAVYLIFRLAKREFGETAAAFFAATAALCAPALASGRMALTHSNAIFVFFTVASVNLAWRYSKRPSPRTLLAAAACYGLSVASSLNGVLTAVYFIIQSRNTPGQPWPKSQLALFFAVSVAVFFAASPIYLVPLYLTSMLVGASGAGGTYFHYNYFGTGSAASPWWFSMLLFVVKLSPWWTLLFLAFPAIAGRRDKSIPAYRLLFSLWAFIVVFLVAKSAVFRYDAPHHEIHVQLFALLIASFSAVELWRRTTARGMKVALAAAVSVAFAAQALLIAAFFPNFLFFGSQYGNRMVGEFYGPASVNCQDMSTVRAKAREFLQSGDEVRVYRMLCWALVDGFKASSDPYGEPTPSQSEFHVITEGIATYHMNASPRERVSIGEIFSKCRLDYTHRMPFGFPAYQLFTCPAGTMVDPGVMAHLELQ